MKKPEKSPGIRAVVRSAILSGDRYKPTDAVRLDVEAAIGAGLIDAESDGITRTYRVTAKGAAMFPGLSSPVRPTLTKTKHPTVARHHR